MHTSGLQSAAHTPKIRNKVTTLQGTVHDVHPCTVAPCTLPPYKLPAYTLLPASATGTVLVLVLYW